MDLAQKSFLILQKFELSGKPYAQRSTLTHSSRATAPGPSRTGD